MNFQDFDQVSGKRDGISSKNITQVGVEEELLLSGWAKNELPEKNFDSETSSSSQQNMENKSGNTVSLCTCRDFEISRYLAKWFDQKCNLFYTEKFVCALRFHHANI